MPKRNGKKDTTGKLTLVLIAQALSTCRDGAGMGKRTRTSDADEKGHTHFQEALFDRSNCTPGSRVRGGTARPRGRVPAHVLPCSTLKLPADRVQKPVPLRHAKLLLGKDLSMYIRPLAGVFFV